MAPVLRFFRQLRRHLLTENRFGRYLLYAVGEIVLVVIGILIALQINKWNEDAQNLRTERDFYNDILVDLDKDSLKLDGLTRFYKNRTEQGGWLLTLIRSADSIPDYKELGKRIQPFYIGPLPVSNNATYEAAKSSGSFVKFKNKDILKNLNQFYADIEELNGILEATLRWLETSLEPILSAYPENYVTAESGTYMITSEQGNLSEYYEFVAAIEDQRNLPVTIGDILQKPEFEYYLTGDLGRSFNALASLRRRSDRITGLKREIGSYLPAQ